MHPDELANLIDKVSDRMRSLGENTSDIERLKISPTIYEVVGKWPPDASLPASKEDIESVVDVLERARLSMMAVDGAAPEAAQIGGVIDCAREHLIFAEALGGDGPITIEPNNVSNLVGPWPPD